MYKRILVPLDGSQTSESILPLASGIAKATGSELHLLYVHATHGSAKAEPLTASGLLLPAYRYLGLIANGLKAKGVDVDATVTSGEPPVAIQEQAQQRSCGLIAMSTHGRTGLGRWVLGSTTDKVVQIATMPLLLRRPAKDDETTEELRPKHIVVPLDGSSLGETALPHAIAIGAALSAPAHLIEVTPLVLGTEGYDSYYDPRVLQELVDAAADYLGEKAAELRRSGLTVDSKVLSGYAASSIIRYAEQLPDSLLVMSTHGRTGVERWVLGSVADRVLRASTCPVLLARPGMTNK